MDRFRALARRHTRDMKEYLHLFGKTAVALFVLQHMAAVFVFSVPTDAAGPFIRALRTDAAPYLYATSQWQEWNLFAPDPQRQIRTFDVDAENGVQWETVATVEPGTFPWWRHATYAKLLPAIFMKERNDYDVFRERFLQILCNDLDIAPGTMVRLRENETIIPYTDQHQSDAWWDAHNPATDSTVIHITSCNASFQ